MVKYNIVQYAMMQCNNLAMIMKLIPMNTTRTYINQSHTTRILDPTRCGRRLPNGCLFYLPNN